MDTMARRLSRFRLVSRLVSLLVVLIGGLVLVGWAFDVEELKTIVPGFVSMKANTAVCFILMSLALTLSGLPGTRVISESLVVVAISVALVTMIEYLTGSSFGIDELIFRDPKSLQLGLPPGRMAAATGLAFVLVGTAILLVDRQRLLLLAQILTLSAVLIPLFSILAYVFGERSITLTSPYTSLAFNTAIAFALLGVGILAKCTETGPMAVFVSDQLGGISLRRLLPVSVITTLALGFAAFLAARSGLYSYAAGMVLFAVVTSVSLSAAIWVNGWLLNQTDEARRRESNWLQLTLRSIGDAVIATDSEGRVHFLNAIAEGLTGWSSEEAEGLPLSTIFRIMNESTRIETESPVQRVLATGNIMGLANSTILIARDGTERPIEDSAAPIKDLRGKTSGVVLVFRDITERHDASRRLRESEEQLKFALRAGRTGTWSLDLESGRFDGSDDCKANHGRAPSERLTFEDLSASILEEDQAGWRRVIEQASAGVTDFEVRYQVRWPDLSVHWVQIRASGSTDSRGKVIALTGVSFDITDQVLAESEVRRKDVRLKLLVENTKDYAAIIIDPQGTILEWQGGAERITGYLAEEALGKPIDMIFTPEDRANGRRATEMKRATETGRAENKRWHLAKDGSRFFADGVMTALFDGPRLTGFGNVFKDATGEKRAEEEKNELMARMALQARLFDTTLSNTPDFQYTFDLEGRFTYINQALSALWQKSPDQVLGKNFAELDYPAELATRLQRQVQQVIETKSRVQNETPYTSFLGTRFYEYIFVPVIAPDGTVEAVAGSTRDITERREVELATRRRAFQLQKLAEIANRINTVLDIDSVLGVVTEEARSLVGAHQAATNMVVDSRQASPIHVVSTSGKHPWRLLPALRDPRFSESVRSLNGSIRLSRDQLEESPRWSAMGCFAGVAPTVNGWIAAPLVGRHGQSIGLIQVSDRSEGEFSGDDEAIIIQLSRLTSIAIENARLYQELRSNDQRKDEFLAMLAHELRNPLAAIGNAVKLTSQTDSREQFDWSLNVITRQMRHLSRLIDDLMDVSRITRGRIELRRDVMDLSPILESAAATVRSMVEERRHRLDLVIDRENLWVNIDPTRMEQVIVNLLNNAAKYSEDGGQIWLSARSEAGQVVISVRDEGVGIAPEKLPEMFELFAQGDRSLARSEGGLGIGLTVVKKLVELHGGTIDARSEGPGQGSEFLIRLPIAQKPPTIRPVPREPAEKLTRKNRILVVDDNKDTARGMARLLKLLGHEVATAHDGFEALRVAREFEPEFVLLDIGLPGMSGYEVAAELRRDEQSKNLLIVAISGYGQEEDRRRSKEAGFDHHLIKPLDHDALLSLLSAGEVGRT